ncbi:MAG: Gfo/Idh/MocA family oxidoreductase [Ruminococcaceae bacterium]|nr:Gfo/Idh/MocA family oxidoreductase [Oscillospiraceae bacterium]
MENVKILSVGIGGFANHYISQMLPKNGDGFEFVGMVEKYPESCKCLDEIKSRNIPIYETMEDFYKEHKADLAIICTPIFLHTSQTLTALKNGSNVMCEKPLSGVSEDAEIIEKEAEKLGKFVMTGFQWSYSKAILDLKKDILDGVFGRAIFLKTLVLWPRDINYFKRGSGWAGKIKTADGTVINDSVAANATAHHLHNMLYVTGKESRSAEALNIKADLIRTNDIENFDTSVVSFDLSEGGKGLFIASHSVKKVVNPTFEYRFEKGTVSYSENEGILRATFTDGSVKEYGAPSKDVHTGKIYEAIRGCRTEHYTPVCSPYTAAAHVRCIEAIQKEEVHLPISDFVKRDGDWIYLEGLDTALESCYNEEKLLRDTPFMEELVK